MDGTFKTCPRPFAQVHFTAIILKFRIQHTTKCMILCKLIGKHFNILIAENYRVYVYYHSKCRTALASFKNVTKER
jgi:hypothetical protein